MSDNYKTDEWILKLFENYYDPCPYNSEYNPELDMDGLIINWGKFAIKNGYEGVFVNPPYSRPWPWVCKAIAEKKINPEINIVMLLKNDSSTEYYRLLHEHGSNFLFPYGRLKYQTGKSAPFSSVLVVL
jgi:hypothetical protein